MVPTAGRELHATCHDRRLLRRNDRATRYTVVVFENRNGNPFRCTAGTAFGERAAAILKDTTRSLPQHVPAGLRAITQRSLSKDSSQRYATTGELRAVLEAIDPSESTAALPTGQQAASPPSIAVLPFYLCDSSFHPELEVRTTASELFGIGNRRDNCKLNSL